MIVNRNLLPGKNKYRYGLLLLTFIALICVAFSMSGSHDFDIARREILLRRIGHEILLQSGDSTSRVLPVKKIAGNEYQIRFENELTFQPEAMVKITQRLLAKDPLASDYVVNVLNCVNATVAYGYAISKNTKDDIVSCIGREQPKACYMINIQFKPMPLIPEKNDYFLGALSLLALMGFVFLRPAKTQQASPEILVTPDIPFAPALPDVAQQRHSDIFTLGTTLFDTATRTLLINEKTIELTKTETRVLSIFAESPNEAVERSRLQKEIWEDEGIIVGRSLDMFISKLRKKLELDPNIKIAVIRGKGYKLEINS